MNIGKINVAMLILVGSIGIGVWGNTIWDAEAQTGDQNAAQGRPPSPVEGEAIEGSENTEGEPVDPALTPPPPPKPLGFNWPHNGGKILAVSFSSDGKTALSVNSEGWIKSWDTKSGKLIGSVHHNINANAAAFFKDKKVGFAKNWDAGSTLLLIDLTNNRKVETVVGHGGGVTALAFSPGGESILSGGWDKRVILWGSEQGEMRRLFAGHDQVVNAVALSHDRSFAVSGSADGTVNVWNTGTGNRIRTIKSHKRGVLTVAISPDSKWVLSGGENKKGKVVDYMIKLWDVARGKLVANLGAHVAEVTTSAFSPDGTRAISGDREGTIKIWDLATRKEVRTIAGEEADITKDEIRVSAFSSDGRRVLSGGGGKIKLWDTATGDPVGPMPFISTAEPVLLGGPS